MSKILKAIIIPAVTVGVFSLLYALITSRGSSDMDERKGEQAAVFEELVDTEDEINIYVERGNLKVIPNKTNSCNVQIFMNSPQKLEKFDYYLSGSGSQLTFDFRLKQPAKILNFYKDITIIVSIPDSYNKNLRVNGKSVSVIAEDMTMDAVSVSTVSGNISLLNFKTEKGEIKTTSGNVYIQALPEVHSLNLESTSGNVDMLLPDLETSELKLSTVSGKLKLGSEYIKGRDYEKSAKDEGNVIFVKTVSGNIYIKER